MTALARLLARATGQAAAGLRPRLPARFEAGGGGDTGGFETVTEETLITSSVAHASSMSAGTSVRHRETPLPQPSTLPDAAPSSSHPARAPDKSSPLASDPDTPPPSKPPSPLFPETASHQKSQSPMTPPPPDATPEIDSAVPTTQTALSDATPQPRKPIDTTLGPLPERLQPVAPADPKTVLHEAHFDRAMPGPTQRRAGADAAADALPDITVHIGRLHVVTQPAKPHTAPERAQPRRAAATLGNYLRGKEDAS